MTATAAALRATAFVALLVATWSCAAWGKTLGNVPVSVHPETLRLVDEHFREVIFHGVNVVVKTPPFIPPTDAFSPGMSFAKQDMEALEGLGLNCIRLGTMWDGVEPTRGWYNETYLELLSWIVNESAQHGIYSLMDMHQDVMSPMFCGEGFPAWAVLPATNSAFPWPAHAPYNTTNGYPSPDDCAKLSWSQYYFTVATGTAFQNFYNNTNGLLDSWAAFWAKVASTVGPLGAAVMGYELMNEPWSGNAVEDILLMLPGVADKQNLQPAWDKGAAAIRSVDTTHSIFFEGVTWDWFNVGFTEVPGGAEWKNKSVLSYHYYAPPDFSIDIQFGARMDDMKRLGCGGLLTEFWGHGVDVMAKCDAEAQGWMLWLYKPFTTGDFDGTPYLFFQNGTMNLEIASHWSRTYAQVIAGTTVTSTYDPVTFHYELVFRGNARVTANTTTIFANEALHYPNGMTVTATTSLGPSFVTWKLAATNYIEVQHDLSAITEGETVTVTIVPL